VVDEQVRFGSKADIEAPSSDVRFTPESGHWLSATGCPLGGQKRFEDHFEVEREKLVQ
jgi:hypothetical protein